MTISDNTILMQTVQTSPLMLSNDYGGTITNYTITHNLLAGGNFCFESGNPGTNTTFMNNHFSRIYYNDCGDGGTTPPTAGSGWARWHPGTGNVWGTGATANVWDNTGTEQGPP